MKGTVSYLNAQGRHRSPAYPSVVSVLFVAGLARAESLLEVDAVAMVPEE